MSRLLSQLLVPSPTSTISLHPSLTSPSGPLLLCLPRCLLLLLPLSLSSLPSPLLLLRTQSSFLPFLIFSLQLLHRPTGSLKVPQILVPWALQVPLSRRPAAVNPPRSPGQGSALPTWVCSLACGVLDPLRTEKVLVRT